jgi:hypothetical protein
MAKADFCPVTDANKLLFLDNLVTAVGTAGATVGLLPAEITTITTARTNLRNAVNDKLTEKTRIALRRPAPISPPAPKRGTTWPSFS